MTNTDTRSLTGGYGGVKEFAYLGSVVASLGRVDTEVMKRIAQASRAFGTLRRAIFKDRSLTIRTKRSVII